MKFILPEGILTQHVIVLGKTGAGKSSAVRVMVEHLLRQKKRVCVIDVKGDWWGLKSSADGKSAGFPVIAFGSFREPKATDVPINRHSGPDVAELITSGNRPCIIGFRGWMPSEITEFWIGSEPKWNGFASTLFNKNEGELYVVISECHNFAPKGKVMDPKAGRVLHWTNRLLSEGRGLGMTFLLDSQRPQKVHNDTLTSCETLVAMRVTYPADRDAIKDWIMGCGDISQGKEVLNSLAGMSRGEGWVWSPEIGFGPQRIQFPFFDTFDSFAPAQLQKKVSDSGWSSVDLEAVKNKLAKVIEEAKDNDPAALKARIRQLEQDAKQKPAAAAVPQVDTGAIERTISIAINKRDTQWMESLKTYHGRIKHELNLVAGLGFVPPPEPEITMPAQPRKEQFAYDLTHKRQVPAARAQSAATSNSNGSGEITGPMQRILDAIAWMESIGVEQPKQSAVAFLAGYTIGGGAYNNPRGALKSAGLIEYPGGDTLALTDAGRRVAHTPETALTQDELHRRVMAQLPGPEQNILKPLLESYPQAIENDVLAEKAGYTPGGGAFNNPRGRLRTLGLVDYPQKGMVKAADLLFI